MTAPTGTVTFLFSDIEGSTTHWELRGSAMTTALRRHDATLRDAIRARDGYVFKTIGDAFCAAFNRPEDAIAAARDVQRRLTESATAPDLTLRVRMAVHSGSADERDGDYFGAVVNRVARLLGIGHAGQIIVSEATAELVRGNLEDGLGLRQLGSHRLRGFEKAELVHQLTAPDLPDDFPALQSVDVVPNNLPIQLTSFIGRVKDIDEIATLLEHHRVVTLIGAGGSGKTRCAAQAGAFLLDQPSDGMWFVELAPLEHGSPVTGAIAKALSIAELPDRPLIDTIVAYGKGKRLTLILDNCEHVLDAVRGTVATILRNCPDIRFMTTSREALQIGGEHVYRIPSLSLPDAGEAITAQHAAASGAVSLFVERARESDGRFVLTDENAGAVAEICRRLDGIPLAIELAAARTKVLPPRQLAERLDERFRLLTGGDRSSLPRQQTMRALIDWSYQLLESGERLLFDTLSIFPSGFSLAQAAACAAPAADEIDVLDTLASLVDKSLVTAELEGPAPRYRLLESFREYAREKLRERGEFEDVAHRHVDVCTRFAEELEREYDVTPDQVWLARARPDLDNWQAALDWSLQRGNDRASGRRLAAALRPVWTNFANAEGRRWVRMALADNGAIEDEVAAQLKIAEAIIDIGFGEYSAALASARGSLAAFERANALNSVGAARAQSVVGRALVHLGDDTAGIALLQEALRGARASGSRRLVGNTLVSIADARSADADLAGAKALYSEALTIFNELESTRSAAFVAANVAEAEFRAGDYAAALRYAEDALDSQQRLGRLHSVTYLLANLAAYSLADNRFDEARYRARSALELTRELHISVDMLWALQHVAAVAVLCPSPEDGAGLIARAHVAQLFGYVDAQLSVAGIVREFTNAQEYDRCIATLQEALGTSSLAEILRLGSSLNEAEAVALALAE